MNFLQRFTSARYAKEGKGIEKDAPPKRAFFAYFELLFQKYGQLFKLNLILCILFLFPSLALFVVGLANFPLQITILIAGLMGISGIFLAPYYYVLKKMYQQEHVFLIRDYFRAFKQNFKQSLIFGLINGALSYVLYLGVSVYFVEAGKNLIYMVPLVLSGIVALLLLFANFYIYLLIVTIELPLSKLIKNALILGLVSLKQNSAIIFFSAIPLATGVGLCYIFSDDLLLVIAVLMALFTPQIIHLLVTFNAYPVIKRLLINPMSEKAELEDVEKND